MADNEISRSDAKKRIAEPPLNMLFNLSLIAKKDVWDIDIPMLLQMLLSIINNTGKKDLRVCGIAVLSSSMIHRLKVESIFRLEKIATQRKGVEDSRDRKSTRLNSSHANISYAVFCLKKKK